MHREHPGTIRKGATTPSAWQTKSFDAGAQSVESYTNLERSRGARGKLLKYFPIVLFGPYPSTTSTYFNIIINYIHPDLRPNIWTHDQYRRVYFNVALVPLLHCSLNAGIHIIKAIEDRDMMFLASISTDFQPEKDQYLIGTPAWETISNSYHPSYAGNLTLRWPSLLLQSSALRSCDPRAKIFPL
jgi:hypothetical protein